MCKTGKILPGQIQISWTILVRNNASDAQTVNRHVIAQKPGESGVRKGQTVNRHVIAKKLWTCGHLSMDCITWTSVNEELFMNNCSCASVHGQLSMDKVYLKPG